MEKIDHTGETYGRLTIVSYDRVELTKGGIRYHRWWCKCSCGNPELKSIRWVSIRRGDSKSCGCRHSEAIVRNAKKMGTANRSHGHTVEGKMSPTYNSWQSMKRKNNVDPNWVSSFENFLLDMGERPKGKTLARIDPDGDFVQGNVQWK